MADVSKMNKGQLMLECTKLKIKGFAGKSEEEMIKMINDHKAAMNSKTTEEIIDKTKGAKVAEASDADDVVIDGDVAEEAKKEVVKPEKIKKNKASSQGRKALDKSKLMANHGTPFLEKSSASIIFKLLLEGGTKADIAKKAEEILNDKQIKCTNPIKRVEKTINYVNAGNCDYGDKKFKVVRDKDGVYKLS